MKKPHTTFTSITWHKASLWTQVYKCLQVLRQTRKAEELRTCYDACALREARAEARTSSRVTEGQLCQCFLHYVRELFPLPSQSKSSYLSQMPHIRSMLLKMPTGTEMHPWLYYYLFLFNSNIFIFPQESMYWNVEGLSCYSLMVKWGNFYSSWHVQQLTQTTGGIVLLTKKERTNKIT